MPQWPQNAHPVESVGLTLDWASSAARLAGNGRMIQIVAQIRILVAVEAIDGRKGRSTPSPSYAGKSSTRIHFPVTCLSSGHGVARPSESCSMTARGSGWPQSACPRDVSNGGPPARKRHGHCERIRLSYCSLPAIPRRKPRRMAAVEFPKKLRKNTCVPFSTLPH